MAGGIEREHRVVLDPDFRRLGEALDVEDGEADALARELGFVAGPWVARTLA